MKKLYFTKLLIVFIALHVSSLLVAQKSTFDFNQLEKRNGSQLITSFNSLEQIAAAAVNYLPTLATNYYWDTLTKSYLGGNVEAIKYNSLGKIISQTSFYPNSKDSISKTLYQYYPNGAGEEEISQRWNGTSWENNRKYTSLIDGYGNETENTNYTWQAITKSWSIESGNKTIYVYDKDDRMLEEIRKGYDNGTFENLNKTVYTYANLLDKGFNAVTFYNWDIIAWVPETRVLDIVWKNFDDFDVTSYL